MANGARKHWPMAGVLFIILVALLALTVCFLRHCYHPYFGSAEPSGGLAGPYRMRGGAVMGQGRKQTGHEFADTLHRLVYAATLSKATAETDPDELAFWRARMRTPTQTPLAPPPGFLGVSHEGGAVIHHKSVREPPPPKPKKRWTRYSKWPDLVDDKGAWDQYWVERGEALQLKLDWSNVRATLMPKVHDNREWAGRINIVKGKPKVVEMVPSPFKIGEGVDPRIARAFVPGELVSRLVNKPAMYFFHTHPGDGVGSGIPSAADIGTALLYTYRGWGAGHLVVSNSGIVVYGAGDGYLKEVWNSQHPHYTAMRRAFDVLTAMMGRRSWGWWKIRDIETMLANFKVSFVAFPTDVYAHDYYATVYRSSGPTDFELLEAYREDLARLEAKVHGPQDGEPVDA